jgi:hypothetical protein
MHELRLECTKHLTDDQKERIERVIVAALLEEDDNETMPIKAPFKILIKSYVPPGLKIARCRVKCNNPLYASVRCEDDVAKHPPAHHGHDASGRRITWWGR